MASLSVPDSRLAALTKARRARRDKARNTVVVTVFPPQNRLAHLDPARRAAVEHRLNLMPKHCRRVYLHAVGGRSPRSAIKAFCRECVGWQRNEARRCTSLACPLWPYRPGHVRQDATGHTPLAPCGDMIGEVEPVARTSRSAAPGAICFDGHICPGFETNHSLDAAHK
jgi:hypothetical protein